MTNRTASLATHSGGAERGAAAAGTPPGLAAMFSAAACCVLPFALAGLGIGASAAGLAVFVPYRWPLTVAALAVVAVGWALYLRQRQACAADASCAVSPPSRATLTMLVVATAFAAISALWGFIEQPLMRTLGGA